MKNLVIGGITIDIEGSPDSKLLFHDSNIGKVRIRPGGVGRNIATNMANLGLVTSMISVVGNDYMGSVAIDDLSKHHIDSSHVLKVDDKSTAIYLSILNEENDMELALNDMEVTNRITKELIDDNYEYINSFDTILIDCNLNQDVISYICEKFKDKILISDTVSVAKADRIKGSLKYLYAIKPNIYEAEVLTGLKIRTEEDIVSVGSELILQGVKNVFISLNRDGVYYTNGTESGFIRPKDDLKIKSSTGAGDSFTASIILGINKGLNIEDIARLGMKAAEITMESIFSVNDELTYENLMNRE